MIDTIGSAIWLTALVGFCVYLAYLDITANRARTRRMRELEERVKNLEIEVVLNNEEEE